MNPQFWTFFITVVLPAPISMLAGLLRQDKLPAIANDTISWLVVIAAATLNTLFNGRLTGNLYLDFIAVLSYCGVLVHTAPFAPLQQYLQSNVLTIGGKKPASVQAPAPLVDVVQMASLVAKELQKYGVTLSLPFQSPPATPTTFNTANAVPQVATTSAYPGPLTLPTSDRGFTALEMQAAQVQATQ